jgi:hypothetical protein
MNSRRQILISHYATLLKKAASWAGLVALMGTTLVATPAGAAGAQLGARSATPTTLKNGATATYAVKYTASATNSAQAIRAIKLEICDSPLETTACAASGTASTNSNGASLGAATFVSDTGTGCNTNAYAASGGGGASTSGTSRLYTNATGNTPGSSQSCVLTTGAVVNPSGVGQKYYLRISTWNDAAATTTELDFGAVALETVNDIVVTANVQESLTFCTGTTTPGTCATLSGTSVKVGTTTDNILTNGTPSGGISYMHIDTNASSGYSITYNAPTLTSGANVIGNPTGTQTMAACAATPTPNNDCFGINTAVSNTATGLGSSAAPSGGVAPTCTGYTTADQYKFTAGSATTFCTAAAPTATTTYTVSYAAMAGPTTKTGAYSATFTWFATGNF